jgi:DNA-binding transcriptional regulator YiaG
MSEMNEEPDLFPEVVRSKRRRVTYRDLLRDELNMIRQVHSVTTPEIARRMQVPSRTMEGWFHGRNLPVEWSSRLVLKELRQLFPRR